VIKKGGAWLKIHEQVKIAVWAVWWPYAAEFPHWHVWRGVCGLVYARRPRSSPPLVVRAGNPVDLLAQIRRAEGKTA
jgi:hypothetical protein